MERDGTHASSERTLIAPTERFRRKCWQLFWILVVVLAVWAVGLGIIAVFQDPFPQFLPGVPPEQKSAWYMGMLFAVEGLLLIGERSYARIKEHREWLHRALQSTYQGSDRPRPSDADVIGLYSGVLGGQELPQFLREVPVWWVLPPGEYDADVVTDASAGRFDRRYLRDLALSYGVSFDNFSEWLIEDSRRRYGRRVNRAMVRLASPPSLHARGDGHRVVGLEVGECRYEDYLLTDYAALWRIEPQEIAVRDLLEARAGGSGWIALANFEESARRYSMMIGVTALITAFRQGTKEPVLILQRRSGRVKEGKGGISASASGGMEWRRDRIVRPSLGGYLLCAWISGGKSLSVVKAALNEAFEELGLRPKDLREGGAFAPAIIGAGYNLLHGRDVNFYLHFHSRLSFEEIVKSSRKARDRWEMQHLVPVRLADLAAAWRGGDSSPGVAMIADEGNRHLLAALTCFFAGGRSGKYDMSVAPKPAQPSSGKAGHRAGPAPRRLILVMGGPGTGKTEVSKLICKLLGAAHLDKDVVNDAFVGSDRESSFYVQHVKSQSYEAVYSLAEENLSHGVSVVLDAPFLKPVKDEKWRDRIATIARRTSAKLDVVQVLLSEKSLRERLRIRNEPRDRKRLEDEEAWKAWIKEEPPATAVTWPGQRVIAFWNEGELTEEKLGSQILGKLKD